jgi:signal transduction histidine kinase
LIDDALDAGVLSRRSFHPTLEVNNVSEQLESYVGMYRDRAERAGMSIVTDIVAGVRARTDQIHLRRAIGAVIENAIRYSRPEVGGTTIRVSLSTSDNEAVVTVVDQGVGLGPEDQKRVFERFYRAGDEMTRRVRGSGLGLYLAREIILAHGGRIKLSSEGPGTGTTVQIHLPLVH